MSEVYLLRKLAKRFTLSGGFGLCLLSVITHGQTLPPLPNPSVPAAELTESPTPVTDETPIAISAPPSREAELEERVRQLEAVVQKLAGQVKQIEPVVVVPKPAVPGAPPAGPRAPGQGTPTVPPPSDAYNMPSKALNQPLRGVFGAGFELRSADDEYVAQFHNLTQVDYRGYQQGGQNPVHDTFALPRQWFMVSGRLTKPYEYFVSAANGFDTFTTLDTFLNVHYDDRLQFKIGRYKTPFTYEFYSLPIQGLINPERSLFFNNFALNRQIGAQVWGQLFTKKLDYAAGIFGTSRNGTLDVSDGKNFLGFLNYRPFLAHEDSPLQFFQFGGSVDVGNDLNLPIPGTLRTIVPTTGNSVAGVPFLAFNNNVRSSGQHTFWDLHAAWYYKHLSMIAEWQSGFTDYALATNLFARTHLPVESFYVQAGYFLTGETVSSRNVVTPLKPLNLKKGNIGLGAVEAFTRYNYLSVGNQVFSNGLADQNNWTNHLYTTDVGFNWYLTQNVKFVFQWEHAVFGSPVLFAPGRRQLTSDMFMARCQIYF